MGEMLFDDCSSYATSKYWHLACYNFTCIKSCSAIQGFEQLKPEDQSHLKPMLGKKPKPTPLKPLPAAKRKSSDDTDGSSKKSRPVSVADFDKQPHLELGVSKIEYAKVKKVSLELACSAWLTAYSK